MICKICKKIYQYDYSVTDEMAYIKKYRYGIISIIYPEWFKWRPCYD